jgi:NAD(P)H-dependent FMN reductase
MSMPTLSATLCPSASGVIPSAILNQIDLVCEELWQLFLQWDSRTMCVVMRSYREPHLIRAQSVRSPEEPGIALQVRL